MPLTEINVTNPPPVFRNAWRERDARRAAMPPPPPWPAIDPGLLEEGRPKLPVFPLQVFPGQWREWVKDAAQWAGSSEDYIAQALLASVAGLCGQGVSARITEAWSEPVILWQALVGGPSSGKTPALEWLRRPLGTVERVLAREGGAPVVVSDASLPALEKAMAQRRQGVLLWRDEPTAWLAGLGRKTRRDESKRGGFLDTWGAIGLPWGREKTAVSIVGSLDPERLDAALLGTGDGLAARFLYVWPGPAPYRSLRTLKPVREDEAVNALQRIARAVGTPEKPLVLAFEDQAVTVFDTCLERLHPETLRAEGLLAGWLGKGRGTVARLAAVLALLDWTANRPNNAPPPSVITAQHLHAAWDLWERYYRPHAQAVFDRGGPADREPPGAAARAAGDRLDPRARRDGDLARGCAARGAQPAGERRRRRRGDPGARAGGRAARGRRRGGLSRPRPPGAALAGQSGAARKTCCANCGKSQPPQRSWGGVVVIRRRRGRKPRVEGPRKTCCANCGKENRSRL